MGVKQQRVNNIKIKDSKNGRKIVEFVLTGNQKNSNATSANGQWDDVVMVTRDELYSKILSFFVKMKNASTEIRINIDGKFYTVQKDDLKSIQLSQVSPGCPDGQVLIENSFMCGK